ncbi:hypothetical protein PVL30_003278 [Lodderomyces elongisporus]|uniref:uncharacterized protein n=1 Tax=Lodderomyces elongisporus TaxID=36914 RepID=UPI00291D0F48|nr:uncharacterized protein PVL30_003278 [Lodderomyces elongisporus]WLF79523.1 hypothetical protein PVL30_003278 [Lodderomyces elongisporus]
MGDNQYYYTATNGLLNLVMAVNNGAATGTGIKKLVDFAHNLQGPIIPTPIVNYCLSTQVNIFGGYPGHDDLAPSIVFAVLFGVIGLVHLIIFIIDQYRGHYFYISAIWVLYSIFKILGFALRAQWSKDITRVQIGLVSEVFLIVPAVVIVSANLILAQRLFTWRHPVGGSRRLFWSFMITTYIFVLILIAVTIVASFVPYLHFLSWGSYRSWIKTVQFTSILVIAYSLTSVTLIALSFWLPTKKDELRYTYQPWWIESFGTFYFPQKGAAQKAEATFMKRNSNHRHATRVIAATHHHFHSVKGLSNSRGNLTHNVSMGLLIITTVLIFIGDIGRAIVVFQARQNRYASHAANKWFMYVCWGVFEVIINLLYIIGRVDLRFYRPDRLPKTVRNIVTAEQTYYPSSDEEEDGFHRDRPETFGKLRGRAEHGYKNSASRQEPASQYYPSDMAYGQHNEGEESAFEDDSEEFDDDIDSDEWDFTVPKQEKISTSSDEVQPHTGTGAGAGTWAPYPAKDPRFDDDNESEFNF